MDHLFSKIEHICGKENVDKFYSTFKEKLSELTKENEKKEIKLKIEGGEVEAKGVGIKIESVDKETYGKFIKSDPSYAENALSLITLTIGIKEPSQAATLEQLLNQFKPMIDELPFVKPYLENKTIEYYLRPDGNKINLDCIFNNEETTKRLKEIGVDFAEYQNFKFLFRTDLSLDKVFDMTLEQIVEKLLAIDLCIEGSTMNAKYLIQALRSALDTVQLTEERPKKKLKKIKNYLNFIWAFISCNFNFKYNAKDLTETLFGLKTVEEAKDEINEGFQQGKGMIEAFGGDNAKGLLEGFGLYEPAKTADIDEITISILSPQYKNGIAFSINLPGITKFLNEKFLSA